MLNKTRGIAVRLGHSFAFGTTVMRCILPQSPSMRILLHRLSGDILIGNRPILVLSLTEASHAIDGMQPVDQFLSLDKIHRYY